MDEITTPFPGLDHIVKTNWIKLSKIAKARKMDLIVPELTFDECDILKLTNITHVFVQLQCILEAAGPKLAGRMQFAWVVHLAGPPLLAMGYYASQITAVEVRKIIDRASCLFEERYYDDASKHPNMLTEDGYPSKSPTCWTSFCQSTAVWMRTMSRRIFPGSSKEQKKALGSDEKHATANTVNATNRAPILFTGANTMVSNYATTDLTETEKQARSSMSSSLGSSSYSTDAAKAKATEGSMYGLAKSDNKLSLIVVLKGVFGKRT